MTAGWRTLREGGLPDTVVVVDFGPGPEAGVTDLVFALDFDGAIIRPAFDPPADSAPLPDGRVLCATWLREIAQRRLPVTAVLGYCASAGLACTLADAISGSRLGQPILLLLDPTTIDTDSLRRLYDVRVAPLLAAIPEPERDAARHSLAAVAAGESERADLLQVAQLLCGLYRRVAAAAYAQLGIRPSMGEELTARFTAFLSYLAAAGSVVPDISALTEAPQEPALLVSRDYQPVPTLPDPTARFDVSRDGLLTDPRVVAVVTEALRGSGRPDHQPGPDDFAAGIT